MCHKWLVVGYALALSASCAQGQASAPADSLQALPEGLAEPSRGNGPLPGTRITLTQELASNVKREKTVQNNRTSLRLEYEKHFFENAYFHVDLIETAFWKRDHRALARRDEFFTESTIRDAFVQYSQGNTSVKLGRQILVWGESDAGAITDVISPRNLSELGFVSLEKARLSQFMLTVDQFTSFGDWGLFYIPHPKFNRYPEPGDAYAVDPFQGSAQVRAGDHRMREFGLRWKKTFGRSDFSVMAARLVDNDPTFRLEGTGGDGRLLVRQEPHRFNMLGATFNLVGGSFLLSGEMAKKSPAAFLNTASLQPVKKDVVDTSLRIEYSLGNGGNHSVSLEAVNRRVLNWDPTILPTPQNMNSMVLGWRNSFFNETLTADWLTVYNATYTSFMHSLFLNYRLNDRITLSLDAFYLNVKDRNNDLHVYRGQNNLVFRASYQF